MDDIKNNIINELTKIGLTKYEAMVYIALLKTPRITAYELSKRSNVPQSKVYATVKDLVRKRIITLSDQLSPSKYIAIPLEDFLENYKKETAYRIEYIKENTKHINDSREYDYFLHFYGTDEINNKVRDMITSSKENIYLDIWAEDYETLYNDLLSAHNRGVKIVSVIYGKVKNELGTVYYHEMAGMKEDANENGKWLSLVIDSSQCLFSILKIKDSCAVWTQNESFMLVTECFITHDILIAEIYSKFRPLLDKEFGYNLANIRKNLYIG